MRRIGLAVAVLVSGAVTVTAMRSFWAQGVGWAVPLMGVGFLVLLAGSSLLGKHQPQDPVTSLQGDDDLSIAYVFSKPSRSRRVISTTVILLFFISLVTQLITDDPIQVVFGYGTLLLLISIVLAGVVEDKNDRKFAARYPELHRRYSLWRKSREAAAADAHVLTQAVLKNWLTGSDPTWFNPKTGKL